MKSVAPAITILVIAMMSLGIVCGQQSEPARPASTPLIKPPSLITINAGSELPFVIDSAASGELVRTSNEAAANNVEQIKREITDLVTRHPNSPAAKEISKILDKSGLKVIEGHGAPPSPSPDRLRKSNPAIEATSRSNNLAVTDEPDRLNSSGDSRGSMLEPSHPTHTGRGTWLNLSFISRTDRQIVGIGCSNCVSTCHLLRT